MPTHTFLSSIVDIAIGIAGFAGIIAAIQHRAVAHWSAQQLILLQILFFASAMAVVFALLPSMLLSAGIAENNIWRIGSGGLLIWYFTAVPYRILQGRKSGVGMAVPAALLVWAAISVSLQIYNLTTHGIAWPYLFGTFSLVVNGFTVFLLLLLKLGWEEQQSTNA